MTILMVIWSLRSAGSEKQLVLLAEALARGGRRVTVLPLIRGGGSERMEALIREARHSGVEFLDAPARGTVSAFGHGLFRLARTGSGIVWTWGRRADLMAKIVKGLGKRFRLVCSLRHADPARFERYRAFDRWGDGRVNLYVSNSHLGCRLLSRTLPDSAGRCRVLYNSLSREELAMEPAPLPETRPRPLIVVMLGNLRVQMKGYEALIELGGRIRLAALPVRIRVGGTGRPEVLAGLRARVCRAGLERQISFEGKVEQPAAFLASGHVFLLNSRAEGFPNALLEAMNLGLPCLSTPVGDVSRVFEDGECIRMVDGRPESILKVLRDLWEDWPRALRLGRQGRQRCRERFNPEALSGNLEALMTELEGGH